MMKKKVQDHLKKLEKIIKEEFDLEFDYQVKYSLRKGIGQCQYSRTFDRITNIILKFNPSLLNEYKEKYIKEVVTHEFAHAVVNHMYPTGYNGYRKVRPHGTEFKKVCNLFGIKGKATTDLFSDSKIFKDDDKMVKYTCDCGYDHRLGPTQHKNMMTGKRTYLCNMCKSKLRLVTKTGGQK